MYKEYLGYEPRSRSVEDLSNAFTQIASANVKNAKGIVRAYVRELKSLCEKNELKPATLKNRIKPIKKLCNANDIEISWHIVDNSLPRPGKSEDRSYTLNELQKMMIMVLVSMQILQVLQRKTSGLSLGILKV